MVHPGLGLNTTPIIMGASCSIQTATTPRRCVTCRNKTRGSAASAIRQRERAGLWLLDRDLLVGRLVGLRLIGTGGEARREGHAGEASSLEHKARVAVVILVGLLLAERVGLLRLVLLRRRLRYRPGARVMIDERLAGVGIVAPCGRAGAGDDLLLGHADIGLSRVRQEGALEGRLGLLAAAATEPGGQNRQQ